MKKRTVRFLLGVILGLSTLVVAQVAYAYLPASYEAVIKSWFNAAGKLVGFQIFERSEPTRSTAGNCKIYMDATANVMKVSCNGAAYTNLIGTGTVSCSDDGAGNLSCNSLTTADQDPANALKIFRNTTARTCAQNGTANMFAFTDTASSTNLLCICDGTSQLFCFPSTGASTAADDTVLTGTASEAAAWKTMPNCPDSGGNHLNYDTSTNTWSCGTS